MVDSQLYSTYTAGFEDAMKILTESMAKEKKLDIAVKEFEVINNTNSQKHANTFKCQYKLWYFQCFHIILQKTIGAGLGVAHYMLEPVQRIPRYRLLLAGKYII